METKNKIINATYELFADKGMEFTLNEVSKLVGIKKASIYAHFPSKEVLLHQLFNEEIDNYFIVIEQNSNTLKELYFGIINYFGCSKEKSLFWKRLLLFPPDTMESEIRQKIVRLSESRLQKVKALIRNEYHSRVKSEKEIDSLTVMFLSLVHGLLSSEFIYSKCVIENYINEEWILFERTLKKEV
ncbi:TetR/AcrR family transcriptional regulator [Faecalicatena contorta]|uniref:DNA-binding transcriptional regulator, AcrR family n=1 Tax=Faecalicatena contorta TaxID=39482 RepID=A0A315ZVQ6_9FIRM|nr:TetR/AcrR family transcriptional regulator [Faecalicatena contorta]PWJ49605.1 TetR family transcriptional regulator [Faecalicatena contorta]SUQ14323.1 DNA-binding transcriptional regulator, AcrR family [Faecalicatena contorta]